MGVRFAIPPSSELFVSRPMLTTQCSTTSGLQNNRRRSLQFRSSHRAISLQLSNYRRRDVELRRRMAPPHSAELHNTMFVEDLGK